ncbi:Os11g0143266, partial [Oryza sativa Japonica Group]
QQRKAEIHHLFLREAATLRLKKLLNHVLLLLLPLIIPNGATILRFLLHPLLYHLPQCTGHLLPRLEGLAVGGKREEVGERKGDGEEAVDELDVLAAEALGGRCARGGAATRGGRGG